MRRLFRLVAASAALAIGAQVHAQVEASLPRQSPLWNALARDLRLEECNRDCTRQRLLLANQATGHCYDSVLPTTRYAAAASDSFWAVDLTLLLRAAGSSGKSLYRAPITVRLADGEVQDVCVPKRLAAAGDEYEVEPFPDLRLVGERRPLQGEGVFMEPTTSERGVLLGDGDRSVGTFGFYALKGKIIDFLFGRSSNSLVRVRLESRPAGSPVFLGPRQVGRTSAEFLIAQKALFELVVRSGREQRLARDCDQEAGRDATAGGRLIRIVCTFGSAMRPR